MLRNGILTLALLACSSAALAEPPVNDLCSNATPIAGPGLYPFTTDDAGPDPNVSGSFPTVWFLYTPSSTGVATISPCGQSPLVISLGLLDSCVSPYSLAGVSGEELVGSGPNCASLVVPVQAGVPMLISVSDGYLPQESGLLQITEATPTPPANDTCAQAQVIVAGTTSVTSQNATGPIGPACSVNEATGPDVFYVYTAPADATLLIRARRTTVPWDFTGQFAHISLFDECSGAQLACGAFSGNAMYMVLQVTAGEDYYIRYAAPGAHFMDGTLILEELPPTQNNYNCANPIPVVAGTNGPYSHLGFPAGDSLLCSRGLVPGQQGTEMTHPAYFTYTPMATGFVQVTSNWYVGLLDGCGGSLLACNTQNVASRDVFLPVVANQPIIIRIAGRPDYDGYDPITLTVAELPPALNDTCAGAAVITSGIYPFNTILAPVTDGSASCANNSVNNDVWFRYNAAQTGTLLLDAGQAAQEGIDCVISVFDGCGGQEIACNDDYVPVVDDVYDGLNSLAHIPLRVTAGNTYLIRVATKDDGPYDQGGPGRGQLTAEFWPIPANDSCASPMTIGDGVTVVHTWGATDDGSATSSCLGPVRKDVWFTYTATGTGILQADTIGSIFSPTRSKLLLGVLSIYDGCNGDELTCNFGDGTPSSSRVFIAVTSGQQVLIRLAGTMSDQDLGGINKGEGDATLSIQVLPPTPLCATPTLGTIEEVEPCGTNPDANNECLGGTAQMIPSLPATIHGTSWYYGTADNPFSATHYADADSYRFTLTHRAEMTVTLVGNAWVSAYLTNSGCADLRHPIAHTGTNTNAYLNVCEPGSFSKVVEPGSYNVSVALLTSFNPFIGGGAPCLLGDEYLVSINSTPLGACCIGPARTCTIKTAAQCASADGVFRGDNTACAGFASIASPFEDLSTAGGTRLSGNTAAVSQNLGFTFNYYGQPFTSVWVYKGGGAINFGVAASGDVLAFPNPAAPNNLLGPLRTSFTGTTAPNGVYVRTDGVAPNRRFTVSWQGVSLQNATLGGGLPDSNNFQVMLYETTNTIEFRYGDITPVPNAIQTYAIGYEDATGTSGGSIPFFQISAGNVSFQIDVNRTPCTCLADFNDNGGLEIQDIFDFLNGWFAGNPRADFNGGGLAVQDIFDFLNAWFAGC